jgi:hypothetical protein
LSYKYVELRTDDEARRYFDWNIATAAQVIKRGDKLGRNRKLVGRRAEVLLTSDRSQWGVMWTHGAMFRGIFAQDLAHAFALLRD